MIDFDQFWADADEYRAHAEEYGIPYQEPLPGVSAAEIQRWEKTQGVSLPQALREALSRQNGGRVRYSEVRVLPLDEIQPAADDLWEYACYNEDEIPDRGLVFEFAQEEAFGGRYFLNFNAQGPQGEPSVYLYHSDPGDLDRQAKRLMRFFERMLDVSEKPQVDWSETEQPGVKILARETIDVSSVYGPGGTSEQVLVQTNDALILYTRRMSQEEQSLSKLTLPLPLDPNWAQVRTLRPAPISTHCLHMQPSESDGIVSIDSTRASDGKWKDSTTHGAPIYGYFESTDRNRLMELRKQLFGDQAASQAQAREESQAMFQQQLDTLPPEARMSVMLQAAMKAREEIDRKFQEQYGNLEPPTGELADMAKLLEQRMAEAMNRAQEHMKKNPVDPGLMQRMQDLLKKSMPEEPGKND
jgi:SMI1/KNR4 family protein SUKH-1